ncbi:MAG: thiamine diphosphokinase [Oscillospiraceae bacterium]|nr:thiamine diphosphokinase [Oscillospiraceae bacterium]
MGRCMIIGAGELEPDFLSDFSWRADDFIICADGGLRYAKQAGIRPDLLVGDQDSFTEGFPEGIPALTCRPEKDDSDMMLALKEGISRGYQEFVLLGATGGRFDHTLANLQTVAYGLEQGVFVTIADRYNLISMLREDTVFLPRMDGCYLSVFSYTPSCEGVTLSGVKYPLSGAKLTNWFPLGLSNEILAQSAQITVEKGTLVVVVSKDRQK